MFRRANAPSDTMFRLRYGGNARERQDDIVRTGRRETGGPGWLT